MGGSVSFPTRTWGQLRARGDRGPCPEDPSHHPGGRHHGLYFIEETARSQPSLHPAPAQRPPPQAPAALWWTQGCTGSGRGCGHGGQHPHPSRLPPKCRLAGFGAGEGGDPDQPGLLGPSAHGMWQEICLRTAHSEEGWALRHQQSHALFEAGLPARSHLFHPRQNPQDPLPPATAWEDTEAGRDFERDTAGPLGLVRSRGTTVPHLPSILNPNLGVTVPGDQALSWR